MKNNQTIKFFILKNLFNKLYSNIEVIIIMKEYNLMNKQKIIDEERNFIRVYMS